MFHCDLKNLHTVIWIHRGVALLLLQMLENGIEIYFHLFTVFIDLMLQINQLI